MRPAALLALVAIAAFPSRAPAADQELRALVLRAGDHATAQQALERAGFVVSTVGLDTTPTGTDLVFLPTGAHAAEDWSSYAAEQAPHLAQLVEAGAVVVEMHQPVGTHALPTWLPDDLPARRTGGSRPMLRVTGGEHPLVARLPRDPHDPTQLAARAHAGTPIAWGLFRTWHGFRVLLHAGSAAGDGALLEAARGRGRIVLSALLLDRSPAEGEESATRDAFFASLREYVDAVKKGTAGAVEPTPCLGDGTPATGEPATCAWNLGLSDVAVYERRNLVRQADELVPSGEPTVVTVAGNALRDRRQYLPGSVARGDLARILAFRLPPSDAASADVAIDLDLLDAAPLPVTGRVSARAVAGAAGESPRVWITGEYELDTRKRAAKDDTHRIEDGAASSSALVDVARGVVLRARVELTYSLRKTDAARGEQPAAVSQAFEYRLRRIRRAREPGVQSEIDVAIERGVAWLREQRREDDAKAPWKPHGAYRIGTTSLVVLTLSACDVPRDDPTLAAGLEWLFAQDPVKTYDRSVALMAVAEAYAPEGERARLHAGGEPTQRDLSEERQAWVLREAAELEKSSHSPGFWGYPTPPGYVVTTDTSNTQYAILGLHAATHMGYEPKESTWLGMLRYFGSVAEKDPAKGSVALIRAGEAIPDESRSTTQNQTPVKRAGGFRYRAAEKRVWGSMTCAGIASLSLVRHHLARIRSRKMTARVEREIDDAILGAWAWLDAHWALDRHPEHPGGRWYYYFLYSLERAGLLDRVKRVGGKDWYAEGVAHLLARQRADGGWTGGKTPDPAETCLALLFLKRATAPVTGR